MCFQEEYAVIAIPVKRLQQTIDDLLSTNLLSGFSEKRLNVIKTIMQYQNRNLDIIPQLF